MSTEVCDVSDEQGVAALVERTESELGPVEVLVCVAGIIQVGPLASMNPSHFTAAVDTMLWGPINTALAVVPRSGTRCVRFGGSGSRRPPRGPDA